MKQHLYQHLVCGGTFDHLHPGHKHFLHTAFSLADKVYIGLTNYPKYQKLLADSVEPFIIRQKHLLGFLNQYNYLNRTQIIPIYNQYGPSINNSCYDSILITHNTLMGAKKINYLRRKQNLKKLSVVNCDLVPNLSSTHIRQGYYQPARTLLHKKIYLPHQKRAYFKQPLGQLIKSPANLDWAITQARTIIKKTKPTLMAVVGDIAVHSFVKNKLPFNLAVIDQKSQRQPINTSWHRQAIKRAKSIIKINNPAGTLSPELFITSNHLSTNNNHIIDIQGEEDLAVLPLILTLPLNSLVFYGQPHQGLVSVRVTSQKKKEVFNLLAHFN